MAKRFTKPSINWAELEKLVPPDQKAKFFAFKGKAEVYFRRVQASPPEPPKINWDEYQKSVPIKGLVDKLKSAYESFKVPVPIDSLSAKVDEQWTSLQPEIKAFCAEQQKIIESATKELARVNSLPKLEDITLEMFYDMFPKQALDPVNRPTFWPHTPEEQEGYVPPETSTVDKKPGKKGGQ